MYFGERWKSIREPRKLRVIHRLRATRARSGVARTSSRLVLVNARCLSLKARESRGNNNSIQIGDNRRWPRQYYGGTSRATSGSEKFDFPGGSGKVRRPQNIGDCQLPLSTAAVFLSARGAGVAARGSCRAIICERRRWLVEIINRGGSFAGGKILSQNRTRAVHTRSINVIYS